LQAEIRVETSHRIESARLCCEECGTIYWIDEGIARMLPRHLDAPQQTEAEQEAEIALKRSEMAARDAQVADYDNMKNLALFGKVEVPYTLRQMNLRPTDVLLEAGCGTGRMTSLFAPLCRSHIGVDFSLESLRVCRQKMDRLGIFNVDLIQADICALPLQSETFHCVVSCGVLEHVPTPESRARMVAEIARAARPQGNIVISAYKHSLYTRLFDKKEGAHSGGIYYVRFHRNELQDLLSTSLQVKKISGVLLYYFTAKCAKNAQNGRN
jgi:ubiquinone/menaquinone biosynthesis C-methylase UbiE/uncharacterized protein YbaR (Trm112 family)